MTSVYPSETRAIAGDFHRLAAPELPGVMRVPVPVLDVMVRLHHGVVRLDRHALVLLRGAHRSHCEAERRSIPGGR